MFYLSEAPSPPLTLFSPPLTHCTYVYTVYTILLHTGKGGGRVEIIREVRGTMLHKAGRKYEHDSLYLQSINSVKHKGDIGVWCFRIHNMQYWYEK
jgi:hypothetical protein